MVGRGGREGRGERHQTEESRVTLQTETSDEHRGAMVAPLHVGAPWDLVAWRRLLGGNRILNMYLSSVHYDTDLQLVVVRVGARNSST